jgi:hypothetical protein
MLLLHQTLISVECQRVLDQATQIDNDYHLQKFSVKPAPLQWKDKAPGVPIGAQVVPKMNPRWEPWSEANKSAKQHFIHLTIEGLKKG